MSRGVLELARAAGLGALLVGLVAGCAPTARTPAASAGPALVRVALLPLEDFGDQMGGSFQARGLLDEGLRRRGYEPVDDAALRRFLLRERVRRAGAVGRMLGRKLDEELGAPVYFLAAVTQYRSSPDTAVSLTARLVASRSGRLLWTGVASAAGAQFQKVLGLGAIDNVSKLVEMEVAELLEGLPPAGVAAALAAEPDAAEARP